MSSLTSSGLSGVLSHYYLTTKSVSKQMCTLAWRKEDDVLCNYGSLDPAVRRSLRRRRDAANLQEQPDEIPRLETRSCSDVMWLVRVNPQSKTLGCLAAA